MKALYKLHARLPSHYLLIFLIGTLFSAFLFYYNHTLAARVILYVFTIYFCFFANHMAFFKFKINQYLASFEGKTFGLVFLITLSFAVSEVAWISDEIIFKNQGGLYNFIINLGWLVGSITTLLVFFILAKAYNFRFSFVQQITWIFATIILIVGFDFIIIHPAIINNSANGFTNIGAIAQFLIYPGIDLIILIMCLGIFLGIMQQKNTKIWYGLIIGFLVLTATNLIYFWLVIKGLYRGIGTMVDFGYPLCYLMVGNALLKYNFKYEYPGSPGERLSKSFIDILIYIRLHRGCIKKDITKNFNITRVTTDARLSHLASKDFIHIEPDGRKRRIYISEAGLDFLNFHESSR